MKNKTLTFHRFSQDFPFPIVFFLLVQCETNAALGVKRIFEQLVRKLSFGNTLTRHLAFLFLFIDLVV